MLWEGRRRLCIPKRESSPAVSRLCGEGGRVMAVGRFGRAAAKFNHFSSVAKTFRDLKFI